MRILKISFLLLFLSLSCNVSAQPFRERALDSVLFTKLNELGLHKMTTTWSQDEGTTLTDIQIFDQRGLRTEHIFYNGIRWIRHKEAFNEQKRRKSFTVYSEKDTAEIASKHLLTYFDSLHYKEETFRLGTELTNTEITEIKRAKDTVWITRSETYVNSNRTEKKLSRIITKGDSLTISEFVGFDKNGEMSSLKVYYYLKKKDKNGNITVTHGNYEIVIDESFRNNETLYADVLEAPEKYIQFQLDGKYPYKYGEEILSVKVYNPQGNLISNSEHSETCNYQYDKDQRLLKVEGFAKEDGGKEKKTFETVYHYDIHGLPLKVVETHGNSGKTITYSFDFQ